MIVEGFGLRIQPRRTEHVVYSFKSASLRRCPGQLYRRLPAVLSQLIIERRLCNFANVFAQTPLNDELSKCQLALSGITIPGRRRRLALFLKE